MQITFININVHQQHKTNVKDYEKSIGNLHFTAVSVRLCFEKKYV